MAKYSCLGEMLPTALKEGGGGGGIPGLNGTKVLAWRVAYVRIAARQTLLRTLQYAVMLAIRVLPPAYSKRVVRGMTGLLLGPRGALPPV